MYKVDPMYGFYSPTQAERGGVIMYAGEFHKPVPVTWVSYNPWLDKDEKFAGGLQDLEYVGLVWYYLENHPTNKERHHRLFRNPYKSF